MTNKNPPLELPVSSKKAIGLRSLNKIKELTLMDLPTFKRDTRQDLWIGEIVNKLNEIIGRLNGER